MGILSWLGWLTVGALGIKDTIETSQINEEARERAINVYHSPYYYGRRGEMFDTQTRERIVIRYGDQGERLFYSLKGRLVRNETEEFKRFMRQKAIAEGKKYYTIPIYGIPHVTNAMIEVETGKMVKVLDSHNEYYYKYYYVYDYAHEKRGDLINISKEEYLDTIYSVLSYVTV